MSTAFLQLGRAIEEASLNAWPPLQQILIDGWIFRYANGYTRRNNSVNPIYRGNLDLTEKISRSEQICQDKGLKPIFRMTPFAHPDHLDTILDQAGYAYRSPTIVQLLRLSSLQSQPQTDSQQRLWSAPTQAWIENYTRMNGVAAVHRLTLERVLANIATKTCFMALMHHGEMVACGLGVLGGSYVGLFDIVVDEAHRGFGLGARLIINILSWAKANGADTAYLQVVADNAPALKLYAKLGFTELYRYWYRVKV